VKPFLKGSKMKIINLTESPRKNKRYRIYLDNGKHYDFGLDTGNTYIDHHDPQKRLAYIARHLGNLSEKRLIDSLTPSPALFSMILLWGPYTNINDNIKYLNKLL
jgi:hypothetical protein